MNFTYFVKVENKYMRKRNREVKDKEIINKILNESLICRVALNDNKYPYIVPMNYGHKDNVLYFHCALKGKKIDLIKQDNNVCFEIEFHHEIMKYEESCQWTTKYRSIIGFGSIEIVTDFEEKERGLDVIMQQHGKNDNKYNKKHVNAMNLLKLSIDSLTAKQSDGWE